MKRTPLYLAIASVLVMTGCASNDPSTEMLRIGELEKQLERQESELQVARSQAGSDQNSSGQMLASGSAMSPDMLPPNAESGMCYARVWVEPRYRSFTQQVMVLEASEAVNITPAKYEWVDETLLVKSGSTVIEEVAAVYATETETFKVKDAQLIWRTGLDAEHAPANSELLASAKVHGIALDKAEPGMCYHEHYLPAEYKTTPQQVEVAAASYRIETVPAEYRWIEKSVLVKDASTEIREIPAEYATETETVVDVPAHTMWKQGSGPIQRLDKGTGEIMCLVDVAATYKTLSKRVLKSAARTEVFEVPAEYKTLKVKELVADAQQQRIEIPARYSSVDITEQVADTEFVWHEVHDTSQPSTTRTGARICLTETPAAYETVNRQVVVTPANTRSIEIPAEYETVRVKKLVSEASERRSTIPAEYETVTVQQVDKDGYMDWRTILCDTNTTPDLIRKLQAKLSEKGYNPGAIDGSVGIDTMNAVNSYQVDNNLPVDKYLNVETLQHLTLL